MRLRFLRFISPTLKYILDNGRREKATKIISGFWLAPGCDVGGSREGATDDVTSPLKHGNKIKCDISLNGIEFVSRGGGGGKQIE